MSTERQSPAEYEQAIRLFMYETEKRCNELISQGLTCPNEQWENWFDDAYKDDFRHVLGEIGNTLREYSHLREGQYHPHD